MVCIERIVMRRSLLYCSIVLMAISALSGCASSSRNKSVNAKSEQTQTDFKVLFAEYAQLARELSELPACPKGRDDLWTNCFGTILTPDGSRYTGEVGHIPDLKSYQENYRTVHELDGKRVYFLGWPGFYQDRFGKRSGLGVYESAGKRYGSVLFDRYLYFGQWADGLKHGFGRFHSYEDRRYIGFFERDQRSGAGVEFDLNGTVRLQGRWEDNKLASVYSLDPSLYAYTGLVRLPRLRLNGLELQYAFESNLAASQTRGEVRELQAELVSPVKSPRVNSPLSLSPPVVRPPRQKESIRSSPGLLVSPSQPDPNGVVTLTITTNSDTASLIVNGDEAGGRADGRYAIKRFAQVGENNFEVVATDRFGNTQRQTVSVNREFVQAAPIIPVLNPLSVRAVKQRDAVAIVIGIEKYRSVPAADFANRDASIFVDYATRALGIPRENIRLLLDDKAGAAEILLTFKNWLPTRIKRGSTDVYVFYSGHGLPSEDGRSLFFLPHEANRDLLERTAISQNELVAAIQNSSPKSVTMFIDSCYSGQSRTGETLLASARPIRIVAKEASSFPSNFTVISASSPDQISSSSPELKHGIFSYYLMRGMEGEADANGDKQITVGEMQNYLSENVTRRAMGMNRTQQPQVVGDISRVLVGR